MANMQRLMLRSDCLLLRLHDSWGARVLKGEDINVLYSSLTFVLILQCCKLVSGPTLWA